MFRHVVEQHAELVRFLWLQRTALAASPRATVGDLNRFDLRLHANVEGLHLAGEAVAPVLARAWTDETPGVSFGRAALALAQRDTAALDRLVALDRAAAPLVSAMGFAQNAHAAQALSYLAGRSDTAARLIAARGLRALRQTAGLAALVADPERSVALVAMEAAGLSRCSEGAITSILREAAHSGDMQAIHALWLAKGELRCLGMLLEAPGTAMDEIATIARLAPPEGLARWLAIYRERPGSRGAAIRVAGAAGFADDLGWLAATLGEPEHAAAGREALAAMLGLGFRSSGADQSSVACQAWLGANAGHFRAGQRYLGGTAISEESISTILRSGPQILRKHAAFEAARVDPGTSVLNIRSPGFRQIRRLRSGYTA